MATGRANKPLSDERRKILKRVKRDLVRDIVADEVLLNGFERI